MIKKTKYKHFLFNCSKITRSGATVCFLAFFVILLFRVSGFAHALEVTYPNLTGFGLPPLNANSSIVDYVKYFFGAGVYVAGILALISFAIGAIGLINPSPESHNESKERMKGAVLGLVLTVAAFIIMRTINPTLVSPTLTGLTPVTLPTATKSPGIYYDSDSGCGAGGSEVGPDTVQQNDLSNVNLPGRVINAIRIINDPENNIYYGVILHDSYGLDKGGACIRPIIKSDPCRQPKGCCVRVDSSPNSIDIFKVNKNPSTSGNGVTFYSETFGNAGRGGKFVVTNEKIPSNYLFIAKTDMKFDYAGSSADQPYRDAYVTFADRPGSMISSSSNYLVALYANVNMAIHTDTGGAIVPSLFPYCQTFNGGTVEELAAQPIILENKTIDAVYIIPMKP